MDDRIRASDADRDQVTARLRDHFADGRLTREELDERVSAALSAKTFGDLRRLMADLPDPARVPQPADLVPHATMPPLAYRRRGPRILPLLAVALLVTLLVHGGGWVLLGFFQVVLVLWLAGCLMAIFAATRFRRRASRHWQGGSGRYHSRY